MSFKNKKIAVVFGGPSSEAEVSKRTANAVFNALQNQNCNIVQIEFSHNIVNDLKDNNIEVVYNAMHGKFGEDGCLQGLLEIIKIPYTHSGLAASALAMNKDFTKTIVANKGVNCPNGKIMNKSQILAEKNLKLPCVIKPLADGSSVGVTIAKTADDVKAENLNDGIEYIVEDYIKGPEISVAVLNGKALGTVEIRPNSGVYDYKSKYTSGASEYFVPAQVPQEIADIAMKYAEIAHAEIGCVGVTRSDVIYSELEGKVYFLEINTHPGMTETSLVPKMAKHAGISFEEICLDILNNAKLEK